MLGYALVFGIGFFVVTERHRRLAQGATDARRLALLARDAKVSHAIEGVLAGLMAVHLAGFALSGFSVLVILGATGILVERLDAP